MNPIQDKIDALTRAAARDAGVDPEGEERRELASHLYDHAAAQADGDPVTADHVERAWAELSPHAAGLLKADGDEPTAPAKPTAMSRTKGAVDPVARKTKEAVERFKAHPAPIAPDAFELAGWGPRLVAYIVDLVTLFVAAGAVVILMETVFWFLWPVMDYLPPLLIISLFFAYVAFEVFRGQTPGKMLLSLRTVNAAGETISWQQGLLMTIPKAAPPLLLIDTLVGYFDDKSAKQRWTERWAETRVVRTR